MLKKRFEMIFVMAVLVAVLIGGYYAVAQAIGINRTYGSNSIAGWGLRQGANDPDTYFVKVNVAGGIGDSVMQLWVADSSLALKTMASARIWSLTVPSAGSISLPANSITNTMTAAIDSTWFTAASIGWGNLKQSIIDSMHYVFQYRSDTGVVRIDKKLVIQQGTNAALTWTYGTDTTLLTISGTAPGAAFVWRANGGTYVSDSMSAAGVPPIYLTHTPLTGHDSLSFGIKIGHGLGLGTNNDSVAVKFGAGLGLVSESLAVKDGWGLTLKTGDSLTIDTTQLMTAFDLHYIHDAGGMINATNDFNFTSAVKITNLVADSCDAFWNMSSVNWTSQAFPLNVLSLYDGNAANMGIYYPMSVDSGATRLNNAVKFTNSSGTADLPESVSFSGRIAYVPDTAVAIDSLTFNMRASSATANVASITPSLFRKRGDLSPELANYAGSATATTGANAWKHVAITSGLGNVSSNEELNVCVVAILDNGHNAYVANVTIWVKGHN